MSSLCLKRRSADVQNWFFWRFYSPGGEGVFCTLCRVTLFIEAAV
jgi:hypothetical protein